MNSKHRSLRADEQVEIIQNLSAKLRDYYIYPDIAEQICTCLQEHLAEGDYAAITEEELFALALTMHLQDVSRDEHLWVRWHVEPLPDHEGQLRHDPEWQEAQRVKAGLKNYGLHRVERLPGNVGYLDVHYLHRPAWGGDTAVAAMNFLANTEALMIDLRNCEGGYPGMTAIFCSYLFGEEPVHLESIYWRDDDLTQEYWTLPYVPGKRYLNKPVYVLVGKATFSAGEGFAYILQAHQRATLVGEKTDGGAHPGASYRIHPHFEAFIPLGRIINPVTGTNWEGRGVVPEVLIPQKQAFRAAYEMALKSVLASLGESPSEPFKVLKEEAQGSLKGLTLAQEICPACGYQSPA